VESFDFRPLANKSVRLGRRTREEYILICQSCIDIDFHDYDV
jgi:hypothetical protein